MKPKEIEKLRLGFVIGHLGVGGAERQILKKIRLLRDYGVDLFVVTLSSGGELSETFTREGIRLYQIPRGHSLEFTRIWKIVRIFRKEKPLIVHGELYDSGAYARIGSWLARVPIRIQAFRSTYPRLRLKYRVSEALLRWITDAYIVNAHAIKIRTVQLHNVKPTKIHVVANIYDPSERPQRRPEEVRRELGLNSAELGVGLIASFSKEKNHLLFLSFARRVLDKGIRARFLLIGDGPERPSITAEIDRLGLSDHVLALGIRHDIPDLLQILDLTVNTSVREGLNNAILESIGAGVPVLGSRVGGTPELVLGGVNGETFEPGSLDDMMEKFETMIGALGAYRSRMQEARGSFLNRFDEKRLTEQTYEIYLKCLTDRGFALRR